MRRLNHRQIEAFRACVQLGSATAAAESLNISQPAVTRLINDLERQIGFDLFERRHRGLQPTTDGLVLFEEVERSFRGLDRIQEIAEAISSHKIGRIRIIALPIYADRMVARGIGQFLKKNPGVVVELENASNEGLVDNLVSEKYDIGITTGTHLVQGIKSIELAKRTAMCVVHPTHPFAKLDRVPITSLPGQPFITLPAGSSFRHALERHVGINDQALHYIGEARTQSAICQIVAVGGGVSVVDPSAIGWQASEICAVPLDPPLQWPVVAITPVRKTLSQVGKALLRDIQQQITAHNA